MNPLFLIGAAIVTMSGAAHARHAQLPTATSPLSDEWIEHFTTGKAEFSTRIDQRFVRLAEGQAFFRRSGPFRGCDAYQAHKKLIVETHYDRFCKILIGVYREIVPDAGLRTMPASPLAEALWPHSGRLKSALDARTAEMVQEATVELLVTLDGWLRTSGLENAYLGVNRAGKVFWQENNLATLSLVCVLPEENRRGAVNGWLKGM